MVIMREISVNTCQYSKSPRKSIEVIITAKAAYTELTKSEVLICIYLLKEVKQLDQKVMKSMLN